VKGFSYGVDNKFLILNTTCDDFVLMILVQTFHHFNIFLFCQNFRKIEKEFGRNGRGQLPIKHLSVILLAKHTFSTKDLYR
jgi:hypothetical protein